MIGNRAFSGLLAVADICARCEGEGWLMEDARGIEHPAADGDGQYRCHCNKLPETPGFIAPVTISLESGRHV